MAAPRLLLLAPLALPCLASPAAGDDSANVCPAGGDCTGGAPRPSKYLWPHARGWPMGGGNSPHSFGAWPCDLKGKLAWSWEPPQGKYKNTGVQAPVVDADRNLYVSTEDELLKFSPDGSVLWSRRMPPGTGWLRRNPSLIDGLLVTSFSTGYAAAFSMDKGEVVWNVSVTDTRCIGLDYGFIIAGEGVVLGDKECPDPGTYKFNKVFALNATDGSHLWDFQPDIGVWNFLPHLLGDGTVAFQTWDGGVYHLRLKDGSVIWHRPGGGKDSWTDGGPALGPGGLFFAVRSSAPQTSAAMGEPGFLDAYDLAAQKHLWTVAFEQTPYTYPAVGRLREGGPLSVVTGVGSLGSLPLQVFVVIGMLRGLALGSLVGILWSACVACRRGGKSCKRRACCGRCCSTWLLGIALCIGGEVLKAPRVFRHSVQAFDVETGQLQWRYDMPEYRWFAARGDETGVLTRLANGHVPLCLPLASSYATLDSQGIFYMGHMDGVLYAIQDRSGNGRIEEESEVCTFDAGGSFSTQGPVLVPGLLAVGTCDSIFVFKE